MSSRLLIVKIGGNIIDDTTSLISFLEKFSAIPGKKILVHGGGRAATKLATELGVETTMVDGRRVTDEANLRIATMVYAGLTNKQIVAHLQAFNCDAVGLSGADANCIQAMKRPVKTIDYGFVGDIMHDSINAAAIKKFLSAGLVPVFSAITHNRQGQLLNTNADTIASALATAMTAYYDTSLIYCFEKKGVLKDVNNESSVIPEINSRSFADLQKRGVVTDGMIPKLQNAFDSIAKGVKDVYIGHADDLHLIQQDQFGTKMVK